MRNFRELKVWEKAHKITLQIYKITKSFPPEERFGLTPQIRRAAASIATNISEGCGRDSERELARFLSIAAGSTSEVEYQIFLACDLDYIGKDDYEYFDKHINELKKMLNSLIKKLKANS